MRQHPPIKMVENPSIALNIVRQDSSVKNLSNAHAYMFRDVKSTPIGGGSSRTGSSVYTPGSVITNISQLYNAVKKIARDDGGLIARDDGGLKYTDKQKSEYLFHYTERDDGTRFSMADAVEQTDRLVAVHNVTEEKLPGELAAKLRESERALADRG